MVMNQNLLVVPESGTAFRSSNSKSVCQICAKSKKSYKPKLVTPCCFGRPCEDRTRDQRIKSLQNRENQSNPEQLTTIES